MLLWIWPSVCWTDLCFCLWIKRCLYVYTLVQSAICRFITAKSQTWHKFKIRDQFYLKIKILWTGWIRAVVKVTAWKSAKRSFTAIWCKNRQKSDIYFALKWHSDLWMFNNKNITYVQSDAEHWIQTVIVFNCTETLNLSLLCLLCFQVEISLVLFLQKRVNPLFWKGAIWRRK